MDKTEALALYTTLAGQAVGARARMERVRLGAVFFVGLMILTLFGFPQTSSHLIIVMGSLIVFALELFETATYRQYMQYQGFAADLEKNVVFPELNPGIKPQKDWEGALTDGMNAGTYPIGFVRAFAARVVSTYLMVFLCVDIGWFAKAYAFPVPAQRFADVLDRLATGAISGWMFVIFAAGFWVVYLSLAAWYLMTRGRGK